MHVVLVVLLAPQQPGQRLAHHPRLVGVERRRDDRRVERVGLLPARGDGPLEVRPERRVRGAGLGAQPDLHGGARAGRDLQHVVRRGLRALRRVRGAPETTWSLIASFGYADVFGTPNSRSLLVSFSQNSSRALSSTCNRHAPSSGCSARADAGPSAVSDGRLIAVAPGPGVAEPERRQQVQGRGLGTAVVGCDQQQDVVRRGLGVLDHHVEVAVLVEDAGVEQLVLEVLLAARPVGREEIVVRERPLRILVLALHVGVRGRGVQVEPVLLRVLAVVALAVGQAEHPLLEDRVGAVPQPERQAQALALVADAGDPVLAPAVRARARLVVREVVPRVAAGAVVLTDGAPLTLGQVRPPRLPRPRTGPCLLQPGVLDGLSLRAHGRDRMGTAAATHHPERGRITRWSHVGRAALDHVVSGGRPLAIKLAPKMRKSTAITASLCRTSQSFISSSRAVACSPPARR